MTPAHPLPCVHVVDDDENFRDSLVYDLQSRGLQAQGHASGEDFLAAWAWGLHGVLVLDIQFEPPHSLQGPQVFARLLALRCPLPILFLTGPFENDVMLCEQLVSQRGDVRYLPKRMAPDAKALAIHSLLARAPARLARAHSDRNLLQVVLDGLPPTEREVMSLVLLGMQTKLISQEIGGEVAVRNLQRASGLKKVPQAQGSWELLAHLVSPLMERMGATDLVHLALLELHHRLCLLDADQQALLMQAVSDSRRLVDVSAHYDLHLTPVYGLLQAADIKRVRVWLKWACQMDVLDATLALFAGDGHARLRADLLGLAVSVLCRRLGRLEAAQMNLLLQALPGAGWSAALRQQLAKDLPPVLKVLNATSIAQVSAWLRRAGQHDMLEAVLAQLPGDGLAPLRTWLSRPGTAPPQAAAAD